jgi:hypothetical protein
LSRFPAPNFRVKAPRQSASRLTWNRLAERTAGIRETPLQGDALDEAS